MNVQDEGKGMMMGKAVVITLIAVAVGVVAGRMWGDMEGKKLSAEEAENKATYETFLTKVKIGGDASLLPELHDKNFVLHVFPIPVSPDSAGIKNAGEIIHTAFPDLDIEVKELVIKGDTIVERTETHGTNTGTFLGTPATNKPVRWTELHMYKFKDGKITDQWSEINVASILGQLGLLPQ